MTEAAADTDTIAVMDTPDDNALMAAVTERQDREAFSRLFALHQQAAYSLALHLTHDQTLAEEAVQEAMLAVWQTRKLPSGSPRKWILGIVANQCLMTLRTQKRRRQREESKRMLSPARAETLSEQAEQRELLGALSSQLEQLPEMDRQMLTLYFGAEISETEIGQALSIPQTTISRKIHEALDSLRRNLSRAGFAAAVPLVSAAGLSRIVLSGYDAPPGLEAGVLARIHGVGGGSAASQLANSARSARHLRWKPAAVGIVTVAAGIVAWALSGGRAPKPQQTGAPVTPTLPAAPAAPAAPAPAAPSQWVWTFEKGPAPDLKVLSADNWTWKQAGTRGFMETPAEQTGVAVLLPVHVPRGKPLMLEYVKQGFGRTGDTCCNTHWIDNYKLAPYREYIKTRKIPPSVTVTRTYIFGRYAVSMEDDLVSSIREFEQDYPSDQLCLIFQNISVLRLELQVIDPADLPKQLKDVEALKPELNAPVPGKNSGVDLTPAKP